jgi:predicted amidohydrolase
MSFVRIALANIRAASTPDESVDLAGAAIAEAGRRQAQVVCFPECYVPGYRWTGQTSPPPDEAFLERAWETVASSARNAGITVVLGTERATTRDC